MATPEQIGHKAKEIFSELIEAAYDERLSVAKPIDEDVIKDMYRLHCDKTHKNTVVTLDSLENFRADVLKDVPGYLEQAAGAYVGSNHTKTQHPEAHYRSEDRQKVLDFSRRISEEMGKYNINTGIHDPVRFYDLTKMITSDLIEQGYSMQDISLCWEKGLEMADIPIPSLDVLNAGWEAMKDVEFSTRAGLNVLVDKMKEYDYAKVTQWDVGYEKAKNIISDMKNAGFKPELTKALWNKALSKLGVRQNGLDDCEQHAFADASNHSQSQSVGLSR